MLMETGRFILGAANPTLLGCQRRSPDAGMQWVIRHLSLSRAPVVSIDLERITRADAPVTVLPALALCQRVGHADC